MRPIALRLRLTILVVAVASLLHAPITAQVESERPRVALTQMPELGELWPGDFNEDGITDVRRGCPIAKDKGVNPPPVR